MSKKIRIGISQGDINGIGYEVILKAFSNDMMMELCTPVLFGSPRIAESVRHHAGLTEVSFRQIGKCSEASDGALNILCLDSKEPLMTPGEGTAEAGKYAYDSLETAIESLKKGEIDALVTAPINKSTIHSEDFHFPGHTEYLQERLGGEGDEALMILFDENMRIALATTHLPLSQVAEAISEELIMRKLQLLNRSLKRDFGIDRPKIAVLGLNPHCGDEGLLGKEEGEKISPAINQARQEGILAFGPYPADGFFARGDYKKFDGVLAMYHDQGLAPFKGLSGGDAVNFTAGLPYVRTSPDHGTGYDIAGKWIADEGSMRSAVYAACDIVRRRKLYDEATKNPLVKQYVARGKDKNVDLSKEEEELS